MILFAVAAHLVTLAALRDAGAAMRSARLVAQRLGIKEWHR